jgi:hypothetical protein
MLERMSFHSQELNLPKSIGENNFEMSSYLLIHPKVSKSSNLKISFKTEREEDREMENPEQNMANCRI